MRQAPHDDEPFKAWLALTVVCHSKLTVSKHEQSFGLENFRFAKVLPRQSFALAKVAPEFRFTRVLRAGLYLYRGDNGMVPARRHSRLAGKMRATT